MHHEKIQGYLTGIILAIVVILIVPILLLAILPSAVGSLVGLSTMTYNYTLANGTTSTGNTIPILGSFFGTSGVIVVVLAVAILLLVLALIFGLFGKGKK